MGRHAPPELDDDEDELLPGVDPWAVALFYVFVFMFAALGIFRVVLYFTL